MRQCRLKASTHTFFLDRVLHHEGLNTDGAPGIKHKQLDRADLRIRMLGEVVLGLNETGQKARSHPEGITLISVGGTKFCVGMGLKAEKRPSELLQRFTAILDGHITPGPAHRWNSKQKNCIHSVSD